MSRRITNEKGEPIAPSRHDSARNGGIAEGTGSLVVAVAAREGFAVRTFRFDPGASVSFGREDSDVVVDDASCSRRHFMVSNSDGKCILLDKDSSNGTFVNGKRATLLVLKAGDEIKAGRTSARIGGNLSGSSLQVMMELRGLDAPLPELEPAGPNESRAEPTVVGARAVELAARKDTQRLDTESGSRAPHSYSFLPGVWQVCEAAFGDASGVAKLDRFVQAVRTLGEADRVAVVELARDGDGLVTLAESVDPDQRHPLPIHRDLVQGCSTLGAAMSIPDVKKDRRYIAAAQGTRLSHAGVVYASIASLGSNYGVLYVEWRKPTDFAQRFMWTWSIAGQAGLLIERNQFAVEMRRAKDSLEQVVAERTKELATAVERLTTAQKMMTQAGKLATVGELASGIVHELRNPLTAILGYADLMVMDPRGGIVDDRLEVIRQQAMRSLRIVRNLLSFARRDEPKQQAVKFDALLDDCVKLVAYEVRRYGTDLKKVIPEDLPAILSDPTQLEHVMLNLIANACHAVSKAENATITVRAAHVDDTVRIEVEDNGRGIPQDALPHLFEPFFTTKPVGSGTGLGLSIARSMVESQGGKIEARNAPGGGAILRVTLPVAGPADGAGECAPEPSTKKMISVLFVDDEPDIRNFAKKLFGMVGFQIAIAESVGAALSLIQQQEFDVLVADYNMPDGTGIDLFEAAKAAGRDFTGRAVFISGTADGAELRRAVNMSHGQFLTKPFNASQIVAMVNNAGRCGT